MKVAIVHELLTMRGGAEKVLKVVSDMFPSAPIYTLLYDEKKLGNWFPKERVRTSKLQRFAKLSTNHHLYLNRFPKAVESFDFSEFDLVISFSSAFTHGIRTSGKTKHLCYVHSPARYLWDRTFDILDQVYNVGAQHHSTSASHGTWQVAAPVQYLKRKYLERTFHKLRQWDAEASERGDKLLAASKAVQRRVELYWRRESDVLYPPVDVSSFELNEGERGDAYVIASTLVPYKRIKIAVQACTKLKRQLRVIGEGPHRKYLKSIAGETIEFLGYISEENLRAELKNARAFILPGKEDFGIAPIEAMACGTPVIAYGEGGALETIISGETGEFFSEPTPASLQETIKKFEDKEYSPEVCRKQSEQFSQEKFVEGLEKAIADL